MTKLTRSEEVKILFDVYSDDIDAHIISGFPENVTQRTVVDLMCGCDKRTIFSADLYRLDRMRRATHLYQIANAKTVEERKTLPCYTCTPRLAGKAVAYAKEIGVTISPASDQVGYLTVVCPAGHSSSVGKSNFVKGWRCQSCVQKTPAELRLQELLATRGYTLVTYDPRGKKNVVLTPNGVQTTLTNSRITQTWPIEKESVNGINVYALHAYYKEDRVFFFLGALPPFLPSTIVDHIQHAEHAILGVFRNAMYAYDVFRARLLTDGPLDTSRKILNINTAWVSPGKFSWGRVPKYHGTLEPIYVSSSK